MKRSVSQESMNSGRRTPDGVTQRPAFLRSLSIEPDSPGPGTFFDDDPAGKSPRDRPLLWGRRPKSKTCATSLSADQGHHNYAKEKIKRDKDGYVQDAEGKRVPVVLQYSSFDFLKDKAKAIVEAHAKEAAQRWNL